MAQHSASSAVNGIARSNDRQDMHQTTSIKLQNKVDCDWGL